MLPEIPAVYIRDVPVDVVAALSAIGVSANADILAFYTKFRGPFASANTGVELLDFNGGRSVVADTLTCRDVHAFPTQYLVLSELLGNAVFVADAQSGRVYNVDFEGGDDELRVGTLAAIHDSFETFLRWYFA